MHSPFDIRGKKCASWTTPEVMAFWDESLQKVDVSIAFHQGLSIKESHAMKETEKHFEKWDLQVEAEYRYMKVQY